MQTEMTKTVGKVGSKGKVSAETDGKPHTKMRPIINEDDQRNLQRFETLAQKLYNKYDAQAISV